MRRWIVFWSIWAGQLASTVIGVFWVRWIVLG